MAKKALTKIKRIASKATTTTNTNGKGRRTTLVPIMVPMTFKGIAAMTGVPAHTVTNKYHQLKAAGKRNIGIADLIEGYKPRSKRK